MATKGVQEGRARAGSAWRKLEEGHALEKVGSSMNRPHRGSAHGSLLLFSKQCLGCTLPDLCECESPHGRRRLTLMTRGDRCSM